MEETYLRLIAEMRRWIERASDADIQKLHSVVGVTQEAIGMYLSMPSKLKTAEQRTELAKNILNMVWLVMVITQGEDDKR